MASAGSDGSNGLKLAGAMVGGGAVVGATSMFGFKRDVILIILCALVALAVIMLIYWVILRWLAARRANPFNQTIAVAAGTTPQSITAAARRAQLDDLRKNFDLGVAKLKAAGRDLYTLPWYLLIGESGSGKTEAIRRSSLPFPPGLQDMFQGTGGTVNMNWWFTNEAIILDTAGRYLFEEVEAGASSEWVEFLQLLVKQRYDCPINGLMLVIPADSLIKDTADQIERKASVIAQQLNRIQTTLNVRFPVYIVITKCDKLNGFRAFFDGLRDPQAQHQILGWSNPTSLDTTFNPELVEEHLREVRKRLLERRLGLIIDPIPIESADGRRIDEVDDLFALPDSLVQLGPRLRRYLETVFVQSAWAQPLFLRGIYFTSSMTKDGALDAQLASLLHVPVESLPEGRSWEQDRSFFLRDIFLKKIFPERGLVTRAVNTGAAQRRRKALVLGAGFAAAITLCVFTWFAKQDLDNGIRGQSEYWQALDSTLTDQPDLNLAFVRPSGQGDGTYRSRLDDQVTIGADQVTIGDFYANSLQRVQEPISVHWALRPASWIVDRTHSLADRRNEDWGLIFVAQGLRPLLDAANTRLQSETPATWSPESTKALAQSLRFEAAASSSYLAQFRPDNPASALGTLGADTLSKTSLTDVASAAGKLTAGDSATPAHLDLAPLLQYTFAGDWEKLKKKRAFAPIDENLLWIQQQKNVWPPHSALFTVPPDGGITHFIEYWNEQINGSNPRLASIMETRKAARGLENSFDELSELCKEIDQKPPLVNVDYQDDLAKWQAAWKRHSVALQTFDKQLAALGWDGNTSLVDIYTSELARVTKEGTAAYTALLAEIPRMKPDAEQDPHCQAIYHQRKSLEDGAAALTSGAVVNDVLQSDLKQLDGSLLSSYASVDGTLIPLYRGVSDVYRTLDGHLEDQPASGKPADSSALAWVDKALVDESQLLQTWHAGIEDAERLMPAQNICKDLRQNGAMLMARMIDPHARSISILALLQGAPSTGEDVQNLIGMRSQDPYTLPVVPLTARTAATPTEPGFNPVVAADVLAAAQKSIQYIDALTKDQAVIDATAIADQRGKFQVAINAYAQLYVGYWAKIEFPKIDLAHANVNSWADAQGINGLPVRASQINKPLAEYADKIDGALNKIVSFLPQANDDANLKQIKSQIAGARAALERDAPPEDDFGTALASWRSLGADPFMARTKLLKLKPSKFLVYLVIPTQTAGADPDFVTAYWNQLSLGLLHLLADESERQAANLRRSLTKFSKFPLAPFDPTVGELTLDELNQLRISLDSIPTPSGSHATGEDVNIGDGGRLNNMDAINAELDRIANGGMSGPRMDQLTQLKQFVNALPTSDSQPQVCKISLPFSPIDPRLARGFSQQWLRAHYTGPDVLDASSQWHDVQVQQEGGVPYRVALQQDRGHDDPSDSLARDIIDAQFPGGNVTFSFFVIPSATDPDVIIPDPIRERRMKTWQLLQLLATRNGRRISDDGKRWCIELKLYDRTQSHIYSTWFQLEFERGLPPINGWFALNALTSN